MDIQQLLHEDNAHAPVKPKQWQGWWFLASVFIGCTICVPVFFIGADVSHQLPYGQFIGATLLSGLILWGIATATGLVGQQTRLSTPLLARVAFGNWGSLLVNIAQGLCAIGWFGIQIGVFAAAFMALSQQVWGITFDAVAVKIIAGLVMASTAVVGFRGLGKVSYAATPLLILLLVAPLVILGWQGQLGQVLKFVPATEPMLFGTLVAMLVGIYSFANTTPDLTRFMKDKRSTIIGLGANFMLAYPLVLILTGTLALATGNHDFMQIMIALGFGSLAILTLFLSTWTTNDTNVYSAALATSQLWPSRPRWLHAAAAGFIGTVFAIFGIFEHFVEWLIFTGNLFPSLAGAYVADYYLTPQHYRRLDKIRRWRWLPLGAWLGGFLVGLATTSPVHMGLGLFTLTGISALDAILVAVVLRWLVQPWCKH